MQSIALAVVHGDPVPVDLRHSIRTARVKGRVLGLGNLSDPAEHFRRARLIEANIRIGQSDRVEYAGHAEGSDLAGEHGLAPRRLHERLSREVVDLARAVLAQNLDHRDLVEDVCGRQGQPVLDVGDALEVESARAPDHPDHLITFGQQPFRQVGTILTGDAGDQRPLLHHSVLEPGARRRKEAETTVGRR